VVAFIQFGVNGRDESVPYAYGMYSATVYAQSMFIPRTPTFTPRTPTVMRDCIYIIRADGRDKSTPTPTECMLRIVHAHQCLSTYTHIYTTCTHCRGRFIVPAYYGIHAAIVHAWLRL